MAKQEDAPAAAPADTSKLPTVDEHALATGNVAPMRFGFWTRGRSEQRIVPSAAHAAAAQLHGWNAHAHHAGQPFRCTREAYEAALKAAGEPITRAEAAGGKPGAVLDAKAVANLNGTKPTVTRYEPHTEALSQYAPKSEA